MLWEVVDRMNIDTISTQEDYENECHELKKAEWNKYNNLPEVKERKKAYNSSLKVKEYKQEYWQRKEVKKRKNELNQEPKNKERIKNYNLIRNCLKRIIKESYLEPTHDITNDIEPDIPIQEEESIRLGMQALA